MQNSGSNVSIGLPVYNGEQYLAEALDSLLGQTYQAFELIISDNGSTDLTADICRSYAEKDSRIRYFRNEQNRGATWNYNYVFELAVGRYFKWAAHDDLCAATYLERCIEALEEQPDVVLAFSKTSVIDANGQFITDYPSRFDLSEPQPHLRLRRFFRARGLCNPIFGVIRADELRKTSLIQSYVASDRVLLGQLALRGRFYEVPEYLFLRREHAQSSVQANLSYRQRVAWFNPNSGYRLQLPRWRWFFEYLLAIQRAPLHQQERLRCYQEMAKRYLLHPGWMVKDFHIAVQELSGQQPVRRKVSSSS